MADIRVAFWNLENLFDTAASPIATDLEFTPAEGWTDAVMQAKIQNLAEIIKLLHGGAGPDLFGVCEIENFAVAQLLLAAIGRPDLKIAHRDSPDLRGIDTCLFYSNKVFKTPPQSAIRNHILHLRYPTRDIFEVELELKDSPAKLLALVNHWPSRRQGRFETEPLRMATAERCGRIVDDYLKFSLTEFLALPDEPATKQIIANRWNRNVLVMGDFNDEPFDRSILDYLQATKDLDVLEEDLKFPAGHNKPVAAAYLGKKAFLFNPMWPLAARSDEGTHYFSGDSQGLPPTHTFNVLDQFLISRGLFYGLQKLRLDPARVEIFNAPPIASGAKKRPKKFDRATKKGYSDHFPIQCRLEIL
ncbi:MAG: hypothetical protein HY735_33275 [Verrucomicrobia bacterium]|nr:hypothetical protein [Verrucomicrobiota bacterium]